MEDEVMTASEQETIELGRRFAARLEPGDVVCLKGELGSGKTHFAKGVGSALGVSEEEVHSPTFTLIREHRGGETDFFHFDCYRLERIEEALEIGAEEYFYGSGVCVIEWPEKIRGIIPEDAIWIEIVKESPSLRSFRIGTKPV
ncbi:MAG: tRNA (adenosine(37)-N6)-threonylcarbamoyltransferase complex ATPase subunit type 1 TsaE [Balneolaceae bacterium]|nr:tRNA (adenosine(37)-N6)-threonylcarbamoyltransferase complex ATPase subunit type 1 TsaE [Balneolaceae bacterium]